MIPAGPATSTSRRDWWSDVLGSPSPLVKQAPTAVALGIAVLIVLHVPDLAADSLAGVVAGAAVVFAATVYAAVLSARGRTSGLAVLIIPMVDILGIGLLRASTGGPQSLFTSLILLPIVWLAAARGLRYVAIVGALSSMSLLLPYVSEPPTQRLELLRAVISPLIFAGVAAIINETSRQLRIRADQAEHLVAERERTLLENAELIGDLRESESRYRDLLTSHESLWNSITAQAVIATDSEGLVVAWNSGAERLFGHSEEEVLHTLRVDSLFPPAVLEKLAEDAAAQQDCETRHDLPGIAPVGVAVRDGDRDGSASGGLLPVADLTSAQVPPGLAALFASAEHEAPLDGDLTVTAAGDLPVPARVTVTHRRGATPGYLLVVSDETRAAEIARLKDEFVGMISHELRTPLSSILGFLDLLRHDSSEPLTPQQIGLVDVIDRNARRLLALVGDLLFSAQAESEGFSLARSSKDIRELITSAIASAGPSAQSQGVELRVDLPRDPVILEVDDRRFGQALDNLLSNAIKFTPTGGMATVGAQRADGVVIVSVRDTGIGIPADEQRMLFTRFFRASTASANAVPGVGLGLVVTRSIVTAHGGSMELSSEEGKGTEFRMIFPVSTASSPDQD